MKNKISILWLTRYPFLKMPSTRIRAYSLYKVFSEHPFFINDFEAKIYFCKPNHKIEVDSNVDIIINQKKTDDESIKFIEKNKKNKLVIFDFDDYVYKYKNFQKIIYLSDFIITDTEINKKYFDAMELKKECYILKDCIDYFPSSIQKPVKGMNNVCWFGKSRFFTDIKWQLKFLSEIGCNINIITGWTLRKGDSRLNGLCNVNIIRWNVNNFVNDLRKSVICLLDHGDKRNKKKNVKSNHKMLVSITNGLPCIVSNSIAYESLANRFNLGYSIVNNIDELKYALDYLNCYENRIKYLKDIQPYIWKNYNNYTVACDLRSLIKMYL